MLGTGTGPGKDSVNVSYQMKLLCDGLRGVISNQAEAWDFSKGRHQEQSLGFLMGVDPSSATCWLCVSRKMPWHLYSCPVLSLLAGQGAV